jgi:hypothetical protein
VWTPPEKVVYAPIPAPKNPPAVEEALAPLVATEPGPSVSVPAEATAPKEEPKPSAVAAPAGGLPRWPGIVALVAGVALAGGGVYELVDANRLKGELEKMRRPGQSLPADLADQARTTASQKSSARQSGCIDWRRGRGRSRGSAVPGPRAVAYGAQVAVGGSF